MPELLKVVETDTIWAAFQKTNEAIDKINSGASAADTERVDGVLIFIGDTEPVDTSGNSIWLFTN